MSINNKDSHKILGLQFSSNALIGILSLTTIIFSVSTSLLVWDRWKVVGLNNSFDPIEETRTLIKKEYLRDIPNNQDFEEGQLKGMVATLNDPYSEYLPKKASEDFDDSLNQRYEGVGIKFNTDTDKITVQRVFQQSPAEEGGVKVGDILKQVEDTVVTKDNMNDIINKIRGKAGTQVKMQLERNSETVNVILTRRAISTDLIYLEFKQDAAIIQITSFGNNLDEKMQAIAKQITINSSVKRIIIDVQDNTGGLLDEAVDVISYFLEPGSIVVKEKSKNGSEIINSRNRLTSLKNYPVSILINEYTASASEILAGALRDNRNAKLIGQKTFGKGVVQRIFTLKNGDSLKLTIAEWLTPKDTAIQGKGLEPDISIPKTQDALETALKS